MRALIKRLCQSTSIHGLAILAFVAFGWHFGKIEAETASSLIAAAVVLLGINEKKPSDE